MRQVHTDVLLLDNIWINSISSQVPEIFILRGCYLKSSLTIGPSLAFIVKLINGIMKVVTILKLIFKE